MHDVTFVTCVTRGEGNAMRPRARAWLLKYSICFHSMVHEVTYWSRMPHTATHLVVEVLDLLPLDTLGGVLLLLGA